MKTTATTLFVLLTLALGTVGCSSSAQLVRGTTVGGQIALHGAYMPAMEDARMVMVEHCHGRFEAVEQGDHVEFRCAGAAASGGEQIALADGHAGL